MKLRERSENVHFQGGLPLGVDTALHTRTQDGQPRDGCDNPMLPPPPTPILQETPENLLSKEEELPSE